MKTAPSVVVIGVGNLWRGDDGVGLAVGRAVASRLTGYDVESAEVDGEPGRLLELWSGRRLAIVVDAARGGGPPGTVHRVDLAADGLGALGRSSRHGGSHALGIADAVRLAEALDRLPDRLVAIGIEGASFTHTDGLDLDRRVADAVAPAVELVVDLVTEHFGASTSGGNSRVSEQ